MRSQALLKWLFGVVFYMCAGNWSLSAQLADDVYCSEFQIDSQHVKKLFVELDNLTFFKNNEFKGNFIKGYTLPGFWLQPKAIYYPLPNLKIETGLHMLRFWGADRYPNYAYSDIANWKANHYQKGFHLLPFFRGQFDLSKNATIVFGNLYGASNHRLITPLYNPELNLIADPETGLQFLLQTKRLDLDVWINWESFIFDKDTHQEAFTFGLSSRIKYNRPESTVHFYTPIQLLAQHRGGEIDTIQQNSVHTLMNGAVGFVTCWNVNHSLVKKVDAGIHLLGYYQQAGTLWPFDSGTGLYTEASADIRDFRVKAAYWYCDDFISMLGSPFYGAVSMSDENTTFSKPQMITLGLEYAKTFGKGYSLGADIDFYHHLAADMISPEGVEKRKGATSFTVGVYFRLTPSFLIKQF